MANRSDESIDNNENETSFAIFFESWLDRQANYLDELLWAQRNCNQQHEDELRSLIARVLSHYQQYFKTKSRAVDDDVFFMFSGTWWSSFERTLLWIAGFKPAVLFRIVANSVGTDLSEEQLQRIDRLRAETKAEESNVAMEMARVQDSVAAPRLLELTRWAGSEVNGERIEVDSVIERLRSSMEMVLESAEALRVTTARKIMEILSPVQTVRFLVAFAQFQLALRLLGLRFEEKRRREEESRRPT